MNSFFIKSIKNSKIAQQYLLSYVLLIIIFVSYIYYRKNQNEYGMKVLPGIISVGISLVPNNKKND